MVQPDTNNQPGRTPGRVQPGSLLEPAPPITTSHEAARSTAALVEKAQQWVAHLVKPQKKQNR